MKPANLFLADLNDGQTVDELTQSLTKLYAAVHQTGKVGSVSLTLTVRPPKKGRSVEYVNTECSIKEKLPRPDTPTDVHWMTDAGEPVRDHPKQQPLPLAAAKQPAKEASNG